MQIPEGVRTVTAEGRDLVSALNVAAQELGIELARVGHKLDLSHFRSPTGGSVARSTVKIIAWERTNDEATPPVVRRAETSGGEERPARAERPPRERRERGERDRDERPRREKPARRGDEAATELRAPEPTTTEASEYAQAWFQTLLGHMGVEGTVKGTGNDERVHLEVRAEKAGRIIGKRGATLGAIRHLLGLAIERRFGPLVIDVDVDDRRTGEEKAAEEARSEEGRRRRRGGARREEGVRGRRPEKGAFPEAKLRALARRAAEKALETGQTITINLELNSYDRRIVHVEVAEVEGVESRSEEREVDGRTVKYVQVSPRS